MLLNPLTSSCLAEDTLAAYLLVAFEGLGIMFWIRLAKAVTKQLNRAHDAASTPFVPSNYLFKLSVPPVRFFFFGTNLCENKARNRGWPQKINLASAHTVANLKISKQSCLRWCQPTQGPFRPAAKKRVPHFGHSYSGHHGFTTWVLSRPGTHNPSPTGFIPCPLAAMHPSGTGPSPDEATACFFRLLALTSRASRWLTPISMVLIPSLGLHCRRLNAGTAHWR